MPTKPVLTPDEAKTIVRLYAEIQESLEAAIETLRGGGRPISGMTLQRYFEAEGVVGRLLGQIKAMTGSSR